MANEVERLFVRLEADMSGLKAELTRAGTMTENTARKMADSWSNLAAPLRSVTGLIGGLAGAAAALGLQAFSRLQQQTLDYASSIKEAAQQTGFGIESLQELRYAAVQLGLSEDQLQGALRRLNVEIGQTIENGEDGDNVFARLGVRLTDTSGRARASEMVFRDVVERLRAIDDPARRAALAFEIFGREAGPRFAQLISEGTAGLDAHAQKARDAAAVLGVDLVNALADTKDKLQALDTELQAKSVRAFGSTTPLALAWLNIQIKTVEALGYAKEAVGAYSAALDGKYVPSADEAVGKSQNLLTVLQELDERYGGRASVLPPLLPPVDMPIPLRAPEDRQAKTSGLTEEEELARRREEIERGTLEAQRQISAEIGQIRASEYSQDLDGFLANAAAKLEAQSKYEHDQRRELEATEQFENALRERRYSATRTAFNDLSTLMASENRRMFEIGKNAAIAETIITTYEGASKAFTALADIPYVGPALGAAAAAAAIAGGLARVSAIRSTHLGSRAIVGVGNNVAVGTGGAGAGSAGGGTNIFVTLPSSGSTPVESVRGLLERIQEGLGDSGGGSRLVVTGG